MAVDPGSAGEQDLAVALRALEDRERIWAARHAAVEEFVRGTAHGHLRTTQRFPTPLIDAAVMARYSAEARARVFAEAATCLEPA